jgi:hypothetical protein
MNRLADGGPAHSVMTKGAGSKKLKREAPGQESDEMIQDPFTSRLMTDRENGGTSNEKK